MSGTNRSAEGSGKISLEGGTKGAQAGEPQQAVNRFVSAVGVRLLPIEKNTRKGILEELRTSAYDMLTGSEPEPKTRRDKKRTEKEGAAETPSKTPSEILKDAFGPPAVVAAKYLNIHGPSRNFKIGGAILSLILALASYPFTPLTYAAAFVLGCLWLYYYGSMVEGVLGVGIGCAAGALHIGMFALAFSLSGAAALPETGLVSTAAASVLYPLMAFFGKTSKNSLGGAGEETEW